MPRTFEYVPALRATLPLLLGVAGPTGSGKTFSGLRLATGMQRITGGDIAVIDTEAKRATAYDKYFKFFHVDFAPPFGPLDYMEAITFAIKKGARHIVVDSMTHEHSGPGGVMDQINTYLDAKCGDDQGKRDRLNMVAHKGPKADRKELNNYIIQAGRGGVNFIFCYRADEKVKPIPGQGIKNVGMTPETTSKLVYEMMAMFLLTPGSDGRPNLKPETPGEKMLTKLPEQFRELLQAGEPLSENLGEKLALWAKGAPPPAPPRHIDELRAAGDAIAPTGEEAYRNFWTKGITAAERELLGGANGKFHQEWKALAAGK